MLKKLCVNPDLWFKVLTGFDLIRAGFGFVLCLVQLLCLVCGASWVVLHGCLYQGVHGMTHEVRRACHLSYWVFSCLGAGIWVRIRVWSGPWLHLDLCIELFFGLFILCIGNLRCVNHFSLVVLWFEFDLISQLSLWFMTDFVLMTLIPIYRVIIWLCIHFEFQRHWRELSKGIYIYIYDMRPPPVGPHGWQTWDCHVSDSCTLSAVTFAPLFYPHLALTLNLHICPPPTSVCHVITTTIFVSSPTILPAPARTLL